MNETMTVFVDATHRPLPVRDALKIITDDWIDSGNSCHQTTMDLRDCCKGLLDEIERLRAVVNSALAYKASMMQTISSRQDTEKPMQGRMALRGEFVSVCEHYEAAEAAEGSDG